ncbi:TPA: hypothetical protein QDA71_004642, partial [Burkholderia vietnamiensis]|nr:hypothetical protein [Burkholderia vietnamiensis]HDR9209441.1 hypothetical protein [Burkholderia vietnamiensis]
ALDESSFTSADFEITTNNKVLLSVVFRANRRYNFTVQEEQAFIKRGIFARRTPGAERESDEVNVESLSYLPNMATEWTKYLRSELRAALPVYDELDALRQRVEEHIQEHVAEPDDRFSREEADELREKLRDLMTKFETLQERSELTDQQVKKLESQIEVLISDLNGFHRGTWYRTAANKIWSIITSVATSPEGRSLLTQAAQKAIGVDSPHNQ